MRKFWLGTGMAVAMAAVAMAQDTTNDGLLSGLLSGGLFAFVIIVVAGIFVWSWLFS